MMVAAGADLQNLVAALDAALLPCLPARELQAADRSTHPSHQGKCLSLCLSASVLFESFFALPLFVSFLLH
jgi:hypothetical protein